MTSDIPKSTIRLEDELKLKLVYAADFEGRSFNKQIWYILKSYILNFEKKYGKISLEDAKEICERRRKDKS